MSRVAIFVCQSYKSLVLALLWLSLCKVFTEFVGFQFIVILKIYRFIIVGIRNKLGRKHLQNLLYKTLLISKIKLEHPAMETS